MKIFPDTVFRGSAGVSPAMFGVPPNIPPTASGETPDDATGTAALPSDALLAGPWSRIREHASRIALCGLASGSCFFSSAAEVDVSKLPPPASVTVDFERDIKPIFENHCYKCHGAEKPKSKFSLITREAALKGGDNNQEDIVPGNSAKSPLIHFVAFLVEDMEMPPPGKGDRLSTEQIGLLRAWIDQGVKWAAEEGPKGPQFSISPMIQWVTVSGNEYKFREHYWMREGGSVGLGNFELKEKIGPDKIVTVEGRLLPNQNDYKVGVTLEQTDVGFARFGFQEYRRYYNDFGGYYGFYTPSTISNDRDLHLDTGRAWADLGLTLPQWPRMTLGYEYQFKDGTKSTLQWGDAGPSFGDSRKIYPGYKDINEKVHIIKFDLAHNIIGVALENNFRAEFYDSKTSRQNGNFYSTKTGKLDKTVQFNEGYNHFQAANTLRLEKQFTDWLFGSAGYLYSRLDGDAAFNQSTIVPKPVPAGFILDEVWQSNQILLDQQTHIFNVNLMLGPWKGLTFAAGVQSEWMRQRGFGDITIPANYGLAPPIINSDLDRAATDETFTLRYTGIPYTVLFADTRFQQESIGQYEQQAGGVYEFLRDTDATSDLKEFRAGFTVSPWQRITFTTHYKHRDRQSDYDHRKDSLEIDPTIGAPRIGDGYSAFIRSREIVTDEVEAKLIVRPATWMKNTLSYKILARDFRTTTDPYYFVVDPTDPTIPLQQITPGGGLLAGNYDASIYSLSTTLTPWRRLYLTTTFSFYQTRTATAHNEDLAIVDYRGDIYNVLTSATFIVNDATDLHARYNFSRADYAQQHEATGLPLGIAYDLHGMEVGVTRHFKKRFTTNLAYGYYTYCEPTAGNANNYTAHGIFATLTMRWP